jgi:hypothetical protein
MNQLLVCKCFETFLFVFTLFRKRYLLIFADILRTYFWVSAESVMTMSPPMLVAKCR